MKWLPLVLVMCLPVVTATTISVVPVFEPLSLHGSDVDEAITEIGEALQASVMSRPMALTGAFPEVLVEAIRSPHRIPTNNPNYTVKEANLLVLCQVGIAAEINEEGLQVKIDVSQLAIPEDVDLTSRQLLRLVLIALRRTLEEYQRPQPQSLLVNVEIVGAEGEEKSPLKENSVKFWVGDPPPSN